MRHGKYGAYMATCQYQQSQPSAWLQTIAIQTSHRYVYYLMDNPPICRYCNHPTHAAHDHLVDLPAGGSAKARLINSSRACQDNEESITPCGSEEGISLECEYVCVCVCVCVCE